MMMMLTSWLVIDTGRSKEDGAKDARPDRSNSICSSRTVACRVDLLVARQTATGEQRPVRTSTSLNGRFKALVHTTFFISTACLLCMDGCAVRQQDRSSTYVRPSHYDVFLLAS